MYLEKPAFNTRPTHMTVRLTYRKWLCIRLQLNRSYPNRKQMRSNKTGSRTQRENEMASAAAAATHQVSGPHFRLDGLQALLYLLVKVRFRRWLVIVVVITVAQCKHRQALVVHEKIKNR